MKNHKNCECLKSNIRYDAITKALETWESGFLFSAKFSTKGPLFR